MEADEVSLNDPLLRVFNALAKLGGVCQERIAELGIAYQDAVWRTILRELANRVEATLFAASAFDATACGKTARSELAGGFVITMDRMVAETRK